MAAAGRVVVEALLYLSWLDFVFSEVLDALEMESRILWNLRLVVLIAVPVGMLRSQYSKQNRILKVSIHFISCRALFFMYLRVRQYQ